MNKLTKKFLVLLVVSLIANCFFFSQAIAQESKPAFEKIPSRPNPDQGPTKVEMGIWIADIDSIDSARQNFVANVFLIMRWKDPRLAHGRNHLLKFQLDDIWSPRIQIANEIGFVRKTLMDTVDVEGDGTITYRQRYVGSFSQPLKLNDFPFDTHVFELQFVPIASTPGDIEFVPFHSFETMSLKEAAGISKNISLPDFTIVDYHAKPFVYELSPISHVKSYVFEFTAKRSRPYYIYKVIFPLILIVMMSWSVFWIDPENIGTEIAIATTSMLTLIAYRFTVDSLVPKVPYMTRLDEFIFVGTALVFLSLIQVNISGILIKREKRNVAKRIDQFSRVLFPSAFVIGSVLTLLY